MTEDYIRFALAARRQQLMLSQRDLAARMNTQQSAVAALEGGKRSPTLPVLLRWIGALNMHLEIHP